VQLAFFLNSNHTLMWGFLSPIRQAVGGNGNPGNRGPPVTPASCAMAKENHLLGATPGADRDMLVKVTFHAIHDSAPENAAMYLTGSLPSLGSWDVKRARKMNRAPNGSWALAIYIPEKAEFLYQYLLIQEPEDGSAVQEPIVLWEGGLERKCKLVERFRRPSNPSRCSSSPRSRARSAAVRSLLARAHRLVGAPDPARRCLWQSESHHGSRG
jgi:hypothetical protein